MLDLKLGWLIQRPALNHYISQYLNLSNVMSHLSHRIDFRIKLDNIKMLFSLWIINLFFLFVFKYIFRMKIK